MITIKQLKSKVAFTWIKKSTKLLSKNFIEFVILGFLMQLPILIALSIATLKISSEENLITEFYTAASSIEYFLVIYLSFYPIILEINSRATIYSINNTFSFERLVEKIQLKTIYKKYKDITVFFFIFLLISAITGGLIGIITTYLILIMIMGNAPFYISYFKIKKLNGILYRNLIVFKRNWEAIFIFTTISLLLMIIVGITIFIGALLVYFYITPSKFGITISIYLTLIIFIQYTSISHYFILKSVFANEGQQTLYTLQTLDTKE